MRVSVELATPEVQGATAASLILKDPESGLPVAEIAIRGAGYIVLTEEEKSEISRVLIAGVPGWNNSVLEIPDREGGYHSTEPPLWTQVAAEQAAKREAQRGGRVVKVAGKKVKLVESLSDIVYPEGAKFLEDGIVVVPSRKGETAEMKRFRRACKRARAQQYAFLAAQKDPSQIEEGEADAEEGGED